MLTDSAIQKARKFALLDPEVRLMLQVRDDNSVAFENLVRKYEKRLIAVFEYIMPTKEGADDLAQEVFMRVYRSRKSYVPRAKFSTWLFTIANNVAKNSKRQKSGRKEVTLQDPREPRQGQILENIAKDSSGLMPSRLVDNVELSEMVRLAILSLSERQRMAIILSKFEHMNYIEIAQAMNTTAEAVKSILSRARTNLKDVLEPYVRSGRSPLS